jgi:hypothetical protein
MWRGRPRVVEFVKLLASIVGSERESDGWAILGCFRHGVNGVEFDVSHGHPLGLQEQVWDFGGDGGPASSAQLDAPVAVAVDSAGNLYIADYAQRIRQVSGGVITTAGDGTYGSSGDGGPKKKWPLCWTVRSLH